MSHLRQIEKNSLRDEYFELLRRGVWFGNLPENLALALFNVGTVVECNPNQIVYFEDGPPKGLSAILDGSVHFETFDRSGQRVLIYAGSSGTWFGEIVESGVGPAALTARAFQRTMVWRVPALTLKRLLRDAQEFVESFAELVAMRVRALREIVCIGQRPTALAQVAGRLALMDRLYKESDSDVDFAVIHITQADLADMTGHSRQTINSIVARLEKEQLIKVGHRRIEILNAERLDVCGDTLSD